MPKKECKAPVFEAHHAIVCFFMWIAMIPVIAVLILFIWIPGVFCVLKQLLYRLNNCTKGNSDPNITL